MAPKWLPGEIITSTSLQQELSRNQSVQNFMEGLDSEQRRRFEELAHHFVYLGFEEGQERIVRSPSEETWARILVAQSEVFLVGIVDTAAYYRNRSEGEQ